MHRSGDREVVPRRRAPASINATNAGPSIGNGVTLRLSLPAGMSVVTTTPGPPASVVYPSYPDTVVYSAGAVAVDSSVKVQIKLKATAKGSLPLTATAVASRNRSNHCQPCRDSDHPRQLTIGS